MIGPSQPEINSFLLGVPLPDQVDLAERAAIMEYEGGFPRAVAEEMARELWDKASFERNARKFPHGGYRAALPRAWKHLPPSTNQSVYGELGV